MVDAGGRPGGDGWRRMEAAPDGAADVVPLDRYDPARAKIAANLQWLCAKAYGRGGPRGADGGAFVRAAGRGALRAAGRGARGRPPCSSRAARVRALGPLPAAPSRWPPAE